MIEQTFWNGEPCVARKVTLVVADAPEVPQYWARDFIGTRRDAVEVVYNGDTFYLDDEDAPAVVIPPEYAEVVGPSSPREAGEGWSKVTLGRGSPQYRHGELRPEPGTVEPRE